MADGGSVTVAAWPASPGAVAALPLAASAAGAPADSIPVQSGPSVTISLTAGCERPLEALKAAATDSAICCHPCDEAVVLLLIARVRRADTRLLISAAVHPGTLCLG